MPTVSFSRKNNAATPANNEPEAPVENTVYESPRDIPVAGRSVNDVQQLPAVVQPATVSTVVASNQNNDVQGEINLSDLRLPRLNLVQRTGDLPDKFGFGEFILNKTCVLGRPLEFIALSLKKQYQEKRPYGDTERGAVYDTIDQVREHGGVIGFGDYQFSELAHVFMLVKQPDNLESDKDAEAVVDLFMYEIAGAKWAPVIYSVGRSSYTSLGKALLTARQFMLRKGLWTGRWTLDSEIQKGPKGTWSIPVPKFKGKLSDEDALLTDSIRRGE
jgi:hypothetical protein